MLEQLFFLTLDNGTARQRTDWIVEAQRPVPIVKAEDSIRIPSSYSDIVWQALGVYGSSGSTGATPQITKRYFGPGAAAPEMTTIHLSTRLRT